MAVIKTGTFNSFKKKWRGHGPPGPHGCGGSDGVDQTWAKGGPLATSGLLQSPQLFSSLSLDLYQNKSRSV